ncbi:hypothetical protein J5N97_006383 [Dioscorea zingiberensis]|uniref:Fanconi Anaemia group E protein C-terminal domain-containing protein n=1 Tax=Dioscorea zingiberensis TaxID=325984 RepID=A0A9D5DCY2_9LILI|nr:hypothetical protein J5N97_006383 [Dioscorea zingiberensis]
MEQWLPLFNIFLNSPSPVGEASLWFQGGLQPSLSTSSFLSLLLSPSPIPQQRSPPNSIFFLTLPSLVQARILFFFSSEHRRFSPSLLRTLAASVLQAGHSDFWVLRAARNLFDVLPLDVSDSLEPSRVVELEENGDEFAFLPNWLRDHAASTTPLLPWLPLSPKHLHSKLHVKDQAFRKNARRTMDFGSESVGRNQDNEMEEFSRPLDALGREKALALRAEFLALNSTSKAMLICEEIRKLCVDYGANNWATILGLIEPWGADDETVSLLLSNLSTENDINATGWPAYVLCSFVLPKYLTLNSPASRVLLSVTIGFCKLHPTAAVDALLFPLTLRKEGINVVLSDVLSRIIKECLNSDACLSILPKHILNLDVWLTPDTVDMLVSVIAENAGKFSKSLKFGNFLLCLVTKCGNASKMHKDSLEKVAKQTDTFVTKSILSKLSDL